MSEANKPEDGAGAPLPWQEVLTKHLTDAGVGDPLPGTDGKSHFQRVAELATQPGKMWRVVNIHEDKVITIDNRTVCKAAAFKLNANRLANKQDICYGAERVPIVPPPLDAEGATLTATTYEEGNRFVVIAEIAAMRVITKVHDSVLNVTEEQTWVVLKSGEKLRFCEAAYDMLGIAIQKGGTP